MKYVLCLLTLLCVAPAFAKPTDPYKAVNQRYDKAMTVWRAGGEISTEDRESAEYSWGKAVHVVSKQPGCGSKQGVLFPEPYRTDHFLAEMKMVFMQPAKHYEVPRSDFAGKSHDALKKRIKDAETPDLHHLFCGVFTALKNEDYDFMVSCYDALNQRDPWMANRLPRLIYDTPEMGVFFKAYSVRKKQGDKNALKEQLMKSVFSDGLEKVSMSDFKGRPLSGVLIYEDGPLVNSVGIEAGDIVMSVFGCRVKSYGQMSMLMRLIFNGATEIPIIFWDGSTYKSVTLPITKDSVIGIKVDSYYPPKNFVSEN